MWPSEAKEQAQPRSMSTYLTRLLLIQPTKKTLKRRSRLTALSLRRSSRPRRSLRNKLNFSLNIDICIYQFFHLFPFISAHKPKSDERSEKRERSRTAALLQYQQPLHYSRKEQKKRTKKTEISGDMCIKWQMLDGDQKKGPEIEKLRMNPKNFTHSFNYIYYYY